MTQKPPRGSAPAPDHIMLSLNGDAKTERTVTWRTSEEITDGYVLYWEAGREEILRQNAEHGLFKSDIDTSAMHWAHLKNLRPGARYEYTCGDDTHRAGPFPFILPPEALTKFKFICLADQQKGDPFDLPDYSDLNRFLKQLLAQHPDCAFFLTAGDNCDSGQHEQQWNGLFSGLEGVAESVPFMMALGNHDNRGFADYRTGTGRYYSEPGEFFQKQFGGSYPDNGPEGWKTENYLFTFGNAQFNFIGLTGDRERNQWLLDTVGGSAAQWKLGVWHFPVFISAVDCERNDYPPLREGLGCFDLLFAGHEHSFGRTYPIRDEELFERPSQGTVHYMLGNSNRNPPGSSTVAKVWHAAFFPHEEMLSAACIAEIDGPRMTLTSVLEDGRIMDRCVIDKAAT